MVLGLLWCNISFAAWVTGKETLPVITEPPGANCVFTNDKGTWKVKSPETVKIKLSKKSLKVVCSKNGYKKTQIILRLKDKQNFFNDIKNDHTSKSDVVIGGISDAVGGKFTETARNIFNAGTAKIIQGITSIKKGPMTSTYATSYTNGSRLGIEKKGKYPFILIKLKNY